MEEYYKNGHKGHAISKRLKRGHEAIYHVIRQLKEGKTAIEVYFQYKKNKQNCGRKPIQLPREEIDYINEQLADEWTPDVIVGRNERPITCRMQTLYRLFEKGIFNQDKLPMKG